MMSGMLFVDQYFFHSGFLDSADLGLRLMKLASLLGGAKADLLDL